MEEEFRKIAKANYERAKAQYLSALKKVGTKGEKLRYLKRTMKW